MTMEYILIGLAIYILIGLFDRSHRREEESRECRHDERLPYKYEPSSTTQNEIECMRLIEPTEKCKKCKNLVVQTNTIRIPGFVRDVYCKGITRFFCKRMDCEFKNRDYK